MRIIRVLYFLHQQQENKLVSTLLLLGGAIRQQKSLKVKTLYSYSIVVLVLLICQLNQVYAPASDLRFYIEKYYLLYSL